MEFKDDLGEGEFIVIDEVHADPSEFKQQRKLGNTFIKPPLKVLQIRLKKIDIEKYGGNVLRSRYIAYRSYRRRQRKLQIRHIIRTSRNNLSKQGSAPNNFSSFKFDDFKIPKKSQTDIVPFERSSDSAIAFQQSLVKSTCINVSPDVSLNGKPLMKKHSEKQFSSERVGGKTKVVKKHRELQSPSSCNIEDKTARTNGVQLQKRLAIDNIESPIDGPVFKKVKKHKKHRNVKDNHTSAEKLKPQSSISQQLAQIDKSPTPIVISDSESPSCCDSQEDISTSTGGLVSPVRSISNEVSQNRLSPVNETNTRELSPVSNEVSQSPVNETNTRELSPVSKEVSQNRLSPVNETNIGELSPVCKEVSQSPVNETNTRELSSVSKEVSQNRLSPVNETNIGELFEVISKVVEKPSLDMQITLTVANDEGNETEEVTGSKSRKRTHSKESSADSVIVYRDENSSLDGNTDELVEVIKDPIYRNVLSKSIKTLQTELESVTDDEEMQTTTIVWAEEKCFEEEEIKEPSKKVRIAEDVIVISDDYLKDLKPVPSDFQLKSVLKVSEKYDNCIRFKKKKRKKTKKKRHSHEINKCRKDYQTERKPKAVVEDNTILLESKRSVRQRPPSMRAIESLQSTDLSNACHRKQQVKLLEVKEGDKLVLTSDGKERNCMNEISRKRSGIPLINVCPTKSIKLSKEKDKLQLITKQPILLGPIMRSRGYQTGTDFVEDKGKGKTRYVISSMSPLFRRKFRCAVPMESIGTQTESSPQMFSDLPRSASKIVPLRCSLDHKSRLSFCKNLWLLQNPINVDSCSRCVPLCSELARLLHSSAKDNTDHNLLSSIMGTEIESLLQLLYRLGCLNVPTPHNHHVSFLTESLENLRHEWLPVSDFNYTIVETTHSISSTFYTLGLLVTNLNKVLACIHQETLHLKGFNKAIEASLVMTLYLRSYLALGCVPPLAFLKKVKTDVKSVLVTSSFEAISNLEKTSVSEALQDCKEKVELAQTKYDDAVLCENNILDEFASKVASSVDVSSDDESTAVEGIERSARTHVTLPRMRKASAHAIPEYSLTTCEAKRSLTSSLLNCSVENIDHQTFLQNLAGNDMSLLSTQHLKRFCDAVNDKFQSMLSAYTVDSDIPLTSQKKKQILVILYRYYSEFLQKTLSIRTTTSQESSTSSSSIQSTSTSLSQPIKNNSSAVASDLDSYRRCTPAVCHSPAINGRLNLSVIQSSSGFTNINEALSVRQVTCTSNVSNNTTATTVSVSAITTSQSPLSVPNTSTVQSALPSVTYGSNQTQSLNETMQSSPLSCLEPFLANNSHPPCQIPAAISRSPVVPLNDNRSFLANSSPNVLLNQSTPLCNTTVSLPHQNYLTDSSCNVQRVRELPSRDLFSAIPSTNHTSLPNQAQYTTATYPSTMSHVASPSLTTSNLTASTSTSLFHKSLMSSAPKPASYLNAARNSFPPQFPVQYSGFQRHDIRTPILPQNSNYTCRSNYVPKPHPSYPLQPPSVRYSGHVNVSQQSSYTYPIPISHGFSNSCMQSSPWYHRNQGGPSQMPHHYPGSNIQPVAAGFSAPRYLMTSVSTNPLSVQTFSGPCVYSSGPRSVMAATRSDVLTNLRRKIYTGHLLTSTATRNSNHTANSVQPLHSQSGPVLIPTATQQLATNSVFPITSGTQSLHSNPVLTPVPVTTATQQSLASSSSSIAQRKIYTGHLLTNSTKNTNHTVNSVQSLQSRNNPVTLTTVPVANATNSVFPITSSTQSVHSRSGPILTPVPVANATNSVFPITSSTQSVHSRSGPILTPVPVANATNSVFSITSNTQSLQSRSGPILTPVPVANATNSVFSITSNTQSLQSRSGPILTPVPVANATNSVFPITSSTQSVHSRSGPILTPVPVATTIQQSSTTNSVFPITSNTQSLQSRNGPILTPVPVATTIQQSNSVFPTTSSMQPLHNPMLTPVPVYKPFTSHVIASGTTASSEPSVDATNSTRRITNTMLASTRSFENLVTLLSLVQQGQKNPGLLKDKIPVTQTQGSKTDKVVERHASHVATAMKDAPAVYTSASEYSPLNRLINSLHSTTDPAIVNNNTVTTTVSPSSIAICTSSSVEKVISTHVKTSVTTTASDNPLSPSCNEPSQVHNVLTSKNSNIDLSNEGTSGNFSNTLATTIQPVITASTGLGVLVCPIVSSSSSITDNSVSSESNGSRTANVEGSTSKFQVTSVMENVPVCTSASEDSCLINSLQTSHSTTNPAIVSNITLTTTVSPSSIGTCTSNSVEKVISTQSIDDEPNVAAKIVSSSSNEQLQVHNVLTSKNASMRIPVKDTYSSQGQFNASEKHSDASLPSTTTDVGPGVSVCSVPIISSVCTRVVDNSVSTSCVTTLAGISSDLSISKSCPKTSSMSSINSVSTSCSTCIYPVSSTSHSHTSPINTFATACQLVNNMTPVATDTNDNSTSLTTINDASKSSVSVISAPSSSTVVTITDIVSVVNSVSDPVSSNILASSNDNSATDNFQPSIFNAQWHKLKSAKSNTCGIPAQSPDPCVVNTNARINSSPTHKAVVSSKTDVLILPSKLLLEAKLQKQSLVLKWNLVSKEQHLQYGIELYDICYAKLADRSCFSFDGCCSAKWMSMGVVKALMLPISVTLTNLCPNQCYAFIVKGVFIGGKTNIYSDIKLLQYIIDK